MNAELRSRLSAARAAALRLAQRSPRVWQEWLSGIHNPWGVSAGLADPWLFLDICEAPDIVDIAADVAGQDLVLWDSELYLDGADYAAYLNAGREGRYWPADPLAGAVVAIALSEADATVAATILAAAAVGEAGSLAVGLPTGVPVYVIRYMAGASRYNREAGFPANRRAMEEQVLLNHAARPLWLVRGDSHPETDLVTGFAPAVPRWAAPYHRGT